jgi:hypothetical protein
MIVLNIKVLRNVSKKSKVVDTMFATFSFITSKKS